MELYRKVRLACRDGMSERAATRHFGVSRQSVRKMLQFSVPPGYRRTAPVRRPKLDELTGLIEQWLEDDRRHGYRKQRHTAKRIFERLRDEHGFTGGYTIVKDYVREHRRHRREMFVPLTHPPGYAQADFGEAWAVIAGVKQKVHFFAFDLPQSDASYVRAYRAATAEAWVDGHVHAFSFFGAVALSIDRGVARPTDPSRPYPGNERSELPPQPQPRAQQGLDDLTCASPPAGNCARATPSLRFRLTPPPASSRPPRTISPRRPRWQCFAPPFGLVSLRP